MTVQIRHLQDLDAETRGQDTGFVVRGAVQRIGAVLASAITIGIIALPFVMFGDVAGLEITHPAAVVILGGLVSSTLLTAFVIPALYPHFVTKAKTEAAPPPLAPEVA